MTARFTTSVAALILIVTGWLTFAYLMRDSILIGGILGWGLPGVLLVGYWLIAASTQDRPENPQPRDESP